MILRQEIIDLKDNNGSIMLKNTIDIQAAKEAAAMAGINGGRSGDRNSDIRCMGFIPPEMFMFDPWLIEAERARRAGDMGEYTKYMKKFFNVHKEFAPIVDKKYWSGGIVHHD